MAAMGRSAAVTEPGASAMPAPQVEVVHVQPSTLLLTPTWQSAGLPVGAGNGRAPSRSRAMSCGARRLPFTASIRAAIAATSGAEKLVPTLKSNWSVYVEATAAVWPVFTVVCSENRQGVPGAVFTQL